MTKYMCETNRETKKLICEIYHKCLGFGALYAVLGNKNVDDMSINHCMTITIPQIKDQHEREMFEKCAIGLMKLNTEIARIMCINEAIMELSGEDDRYAGLVIRDLLMYALKCHIKIEHNPHDDGPCYRCPYQPTNGKLYRGERRNCTELMLNDVRDYFKIDGKDDN